MNHEGRDERLIFGQDNDSRVHIKNLRSASEFGERFWPMRMTWDNKRMSGSLEDFSDAR